MTCASSVDAATTPTRERRSTPGDGRSGARFFGTVSVRQDHSLTPGDHPRLGPTRLEEWLSQARAR